MENSHTERRSNSWATSHTGEGFSIPHYYESSQQHLNVPETKESMQYNDDAHPHQTYHGNGAGVYQSGTEPQEFIQPTAGAIINTTPRAVHNPPTENINIAMQLGPVTPVGQAHASPPHELLPIKRTPQRGWKNIRNRGTVFQWLKSPHLFMAPTASHMLSHELRYRDPAGRVKKGRLDVDRYPQVGWARVKVLVVITTDDIYASPTALTPGVHSWRRTWINNAGPLLMRLAYWPVNHVKNLDDEMSREDLKLLIMKWIPACLGLAILLPLPTDAYIPPYHGKYAPFPYRFYHHPKFYVNKNENRLGSTVEVDLIKERLLRPSRLIYLEDQAGVIAGEGDKHPIDGNVFTKYIFVAYSTAQFLHSSVADMEMLLKVAEGAARSAGVDAFWCAAFCMQGEALEADMYRMSDIIRGSDSLVIALKPSDDPHVLKDAGSSDPLVQWGKRMWTFPEALLSPSHKDIHVYTVETLHTKPEAGAVSTTLEVIAKRDFALRVWSDAPEARQLMDHYLGTQLLSRLELSVIAFRCLFTRRMRDQYHQGDLAYALSGLLRRRPIIDTTDSEFEAFARLSMANDSDCLLERLICTLPKEYGQHWLASDDAWGASPWLIEPMCQVAGIAADDTVVIDGCFSAGIEWGGFTQIAYSRRKTIVRTAAEVLLLRASTLILATFSALALANLAFIPLVLIFVAVIFASPYLLRITYGGKFWSSEARLFGFEGYMDADTIEKHIFGYSLGRFSWSAAGSPLSRHVTNEYEERIGRDPTEDPRIRRIVDEARNNAFGKQKIFTIVDTLTMTLHLVPAVRPPVVALVCGKEGGMLRAVLCSYDWKTQTLTRQSVLRMETPSIDYMYRISRVRFGFERPVEIEHKMEQLKMEGEGMV